MALVRTVFVVVTAALAVPLGCSTKDEPASADDAEPKLPAEDGSSAACTDLGGTCVTFQQSCPVAQQNPALCGDSVMICCLPEGGAIIVQPGPDATAETGPQPESGTGPETGHEAGPEAAPETGPETGPEASPDSPGD
jgi:hypothetical protein